MPDVLDVVAVLQHVDELLHVLHVALGLQADVVLFSYIRGLFVYCPFLLRRF